MQGCCWQKERKQVLCPPGYVFQVRPAPLLAERALFASGGWWGCSHFRGFTLVYCAFSPRWACVCGSVSVCFTLVRPPFVASCLRRVASSFVLCSCLSPAGSVSQHWQLRFVRSPAASQPYRWPGLRFEFRSGWGCVFGAARFARCPCSIPGCRHALLASRWCWGCASAFTWGCLLFLGTCLGGRHSLALPLAGAYFASARS